MLKEIISAKGTEPISRVYSISIIIRSFKGRRNVQAHLFRTSIGNDELNSPYLTGCIDTASSHQAVAHCLPGSIEDTKRMILETFTREERDDVIRYVEKQYGNRLEAVTAAPISFPVPKGTMPLCSFPEGKSMGFIRFEDMPDYPLPFTFHGFYDLEQHDPILTDSTSL